MSSVNTCNDLVTTAERVQPSPGISAFVSSKLKFWSFMAMVLLVFVHGYTLEIRYLQPWTVPGEAMTPTAFFEYFVANGILRFRIPMLFLISGYLFALHDAQPHGERVMKRLRTLGIPYLAWSGLWLVLLYVAEFNSSFREWIAASTIAQFDENTFNVQAYSAGELLLRWTLAPLPYQLWFIRSLLIYNLMYPLLLRWVAKPLSRRVFFGFASLLWLFSIQVFLMEGEGLLFFTLGIWLQRSGFDIERPGRFFSPARWGVVFVTAAAVKTWIAFSLAAQLGDAIFPVLLFLHKLTVLSGLVFAWYGGDALVRIAMANRRFVWATSFSFFIYATHAPVVAILIDPFFALIGHVPGYRLITFFVLPMLLIAAAIGLGATLRRLMPATYGVLTGGRGL